MEVLFNKELFDKLSTTQIENLVDEADDIALEKMVFLKGLVQRFRNEDAGLEPEDALPVKEVVPLKDYRESLEIPEKSLFNERLFDSLSSEQIYRLIKKSERSLLKRIRELGGFAENELDERYGTEYLEEENFGCSKLNKFRGNWIEDLTCGEFEDWQGFLVFRAEVGLVLYHASDSFVTGDPRNEPLWLGSYYNSIHYVGEGGHMNIFHIKRSPRLLVLNDVDNIEKVLKMSTSEEQEAIKMVTGVGNTELSESKRTFGCVYKDKDPRTFSRFSSRDEDAIMANTICSIPGIDGYIMPEVNYCSSGLAYREGEPLPKAKRMYGEVMFCEGAKFLERVVDPAIECETGEPCDLTEDMWKKEFERK